MNLFKRLLGLKLALSRLCLAILRSVVPLKGMPSQKASHASQDPSAPEASRIESAAVMRSEPGLQSGAISATRMLPRTAPREIGEAVDSSRYSPLRPARSAIRTARRVRAQARDTGARPTTFPDGRTGIRSKPGSRVPGIAGYVSCASLMSAQVWGLEATMAWVAFGRITFPSTRAPSAR